MAACHRVHFHILFADLLLRPQLKEPRRWQWMTPGAAFGCLLWLLASVLFRIYLHHFNTYSVRTDHWCGHDSIAVAYVTGLAYLLGGTINAEIERATKRRTCRAIALVSRLSWDACVTSRSEARSADVAGGKKRP